MESKAKKNENSGEILLAVVIALVAALSIFFIQVIYYNIKEKAQILELSEEEISEYSDIAGNAVYAFRLSKSSFVSISSDEEFSVIFYSQNGNYSITHDPFTDKSLSMGTDDICFITGSGDITVDIAPEYSIAPMDAIIFASLFIACIFPLYSREAKRRIQEGEEL